jgi:excisionase family DNA binding protein
MEFNPLPAYDITLNQWKSVMVMGRLVMDRNAEYSSLGPALLTAREAASYLRVSLSTLNRMERRGALNPLRTPGGHRRYTVEMLNDCLSQQKLAGGMK